MKKVCQTLFLAGLLVGMANGFDYSATMTINTTSDWANLSAGTTVNNFPVVVRLSGAELDFNQVKSDGSDIRFQDAGGNDLDYEIERWDKTNEQAVVWVKIPQISGNTTQDITMLWGDAGASDVSSSTDVFETANGFYGVYHLDEDQSGTGTVGVYKDATANAVHGKDGVSAAGKAGILGRGQEFDNAKDYILLGTGDPSTTALTLSAWVLWEGHGNTHDVLLSKRTEWSPTGMRWQLVYSYKSKHMNLHGWHEDDQAEFDTALPTPGQWAHVVCTWLPGTGNTKLYYNGAQVGGDKTMELSSDVSAPMHIGQAHVKASEAFNGSMDEVRIATEVRSPEWIKLSYENQKSVQNLVSLPVVQGCNQAFEVANIPEAQEGKTFEVTGTVTCAKRYYWAEVMDGVSRVIPMGGLTITGSVPRISKDTVYNYRLVAEFASGWDSIDVNVNVKNSMPDPILELTEVAETWNGVDTLIITPNISNKSNIAALDPPYNTINYKWTTAGVYVSKTEDEDNNYILKSASSSGDLQVILCTDNGGAIVCDSLDITVEKLAPLILTAPNGDEDLTAGSTTNITWETNSPDITQVHLQYHTGDGNWLLIKAYAENTGSYEWTVPNINAAGVVVRVASATGGVVDESDAPIEITGASSIRAQQKADQITFHISGQEVLNWSQEYRILVISDAEGSLIRELPISSSRITWDLRDRQGRQVPRGMYVFRLLGEDTARQYKLIVR